MIPSQDTYILASSTSSGHLALISSNGKCFSSAAVDAVACRRCGEDQGQNSCGRSSASRFGLLLCSSNGERDQTLISYSSETICLFLISSSDNPPGVLAYLQTLRSSELLPFSFRPGLGSKEVDAALSMSVDDL